jgi:hypothetical protein
VKKIWGIIAIVIIIGAGVYLTSYLGGKGKKELVAPFSCPLACEACGKAYISKITVPPVKCFYCGEKSAWPASQCAACGEIFPIVKGKDPGPQARVCPKCGKNKFKEVSANGLEIH